MSERERERERKRERGEEWRRGSEVGGKSYSCSKAIGTGIERWLNKVKAVTTNALESVGMMLNRKVIIIIGRM